MIRDTCPRCGSPLDRRTALFNRDDVDRIVREQLAEREAEIKGLRERAEKAERILADYEGTDEVVGGLMNGDPPRS